MGVPVVLRLPPEWTGRSQPASGFRSFAGSASTVVAPRRTGCRPLNFRREVDALGQ